MPAWLTLHPPEGVAFARVVGDDESVVIGRAPDCGIVLAHDSVSRHHARLARDGQGAWVIEDLGSKNGLRIDGLATARAVLGEARWFAVGDVFAEFRALDAAAAARIEQRAQTRRSSSREWSAHLAAQRDPQRMLSGLIAGIVDLAECRRGFLLVASREHGPRVRACYAMDPSELASQQFSGSRSAVDRTLTERRPLYISDRRDHAWLRNKPSVVARGIRALVCLPLMHDGRLLGVAYADTDDEAKTFTALDAQLLEAFADRAAAMLVADEIGAALAAVEEWVAVEDARGERPRARGPAPAWDRVTQAGLG